MHGRLTSCRIGPICPGRWWLLGLLVAMVAGACTREPRSVVLVSRSTPDLDAPCPAKSCTQLALEGFACPGWRAETVVVAGHSFPPRVVGQEPAVVAAAVACFHPGLVVLDTCYGASEPLLQALLDAGVSAWVVAPAFQVPRRGLRMEDAVFAAGAPATRALLVHAEPPAPLLRWFLDVGQLQELRRAAAALEPAELRARLRLRSPPLVRMPVPGALEPGGEVLVPVLPERFQ